MVQIVVVDIAEKLSKLNVLPPFLDFISEGELELFLTIEGEADFLEPAVMLFALPNDNLEYLELLISVGVSGNLAYLSRVCRYFLLGFI